MYQEFFFVIDNKEAVLRHRRKLPEVIPEYERLRIVSIVKDKYASCTCGYPARLKCPCSHVIAVFGGIYLSMVYNGYWVINITFKEKVRRENQHYSVQLKRKNLNATEKMVNTSW